MALVEDLAKIAATLHAVETTLVARSRAVSAPRRRLQLLRLARRSLNLRKAVEIAVRQVERGVLPK